MLGNKFGMAGIIAMLFTLDIASTEIDSFTLRSEGMMDATAELNDMMQMYIEDSINKANEVSRCNEDFFRSIFHERVGGVFWTALENDIPNNNRIDSRTIDREDSIYQDFYCFEAPALCLASLGYLMRMQDFYIGSDKLGHFLEEGYAYFEDLQRGATVEEAIMRGESQEASYFGLQTTGIYSYADLAANMDGGVHFWKNLVSADKSNADAYVTCERGKFVINRNFDWSDYINAAWDEGINCSRYKTENMEQSVRTRITSLEKQRHLKLRCPIEPEQCPVMIERYGKLASHVITPKCFS